MQEQNKSDVTLEVPGGTARARIVKIFETLSGMVKIAEGESMRDVHRMNQLATVARDYRRASRGIGAAKFVRALENNPARAKSKHAGGHKLAPREPAHLCELVPIKGAAKKKMRNGKVTDVPRGRSYPNVKMLGFWVSPRALRIKNAKLARKRAQEMGGAL